MSDEHSFIDDNGKAWTACCECDRGGNGNAKDKCSSGWQCTEWNQLGCFIGEKIIGEIKPVKKESRSKQRYRRYLEYSDCFDSFLDFCYWDAESGRSWN